MTEAVAVHETAVSLLIEVPAGIYAGTDVALKARVSCPSNCDLRGGRVRVADAQGDIVTEIELLQFNGAVN